MNKRILVKKKTQFLIESISLLKDIQINLNEDKLESLEIYNIYDLFNVDEAEINILKSQILAEIVTDDVFEEINLTNKQFLAYEFLPGQYDQRADSALQCLTLLGSGENAQIKSGRLIVFNGEIKSLDKIKKYLINPIEMHEKQLDVLENNENTSIEPVIKYDNFINYTNDELERFLNAQECAFNINDLKHIQNYFKNEEKRDPTETEIKVIDTYWSDHCRHTTFETYLENIKFCEGELKHQLENAFNEYLGLRKELNIDTRPITLMDVATIGAKYLKKIGKLNDLEISEENNACSIEVDVDVDGKLEKYLLMFKNETHNHPTEIEPFGGASTCIGGAIRDPLSGRAYVYQAMRITGSGDITKPIENTMENKLPQSIISKRAAQGYSAYGNQIGLATTFVKEIYHQGYAAKHMEVGAVVGCVKKDNVWRETPQANDLVIVIGGRTGRDGIGGATGSSKEHNDASLEKCSSEVQKGNAPIERKIQRLFRNPEVTKMIKKSNDFGAGGVSVAIGEIADGVEINLNNLLTKYNGLNGTELAISESQERMAIVISPENQARFFELLKEENLEGSILATVTKEKRLIIKWNDVTIVNLSRTFLNTNGATASQEVDVICDTKASNNIDWNKDNLVKMLSSLNVASQQGMGEMFDYSVGRSTVLAPYGGDKQLTQEEASVQKLATFGNTTTCSILTYGYNPFISENSPYLGGAYAVIESLCKITAVGGDYKKARLSFQEYFEKLSDQNKKWGKPLAALLGALQAQINFNTPAIGGKDSMSGTFKNINVPPTLISFAVAPENVENIISKHTTNEAPYIYLIEHQENHDGTPNYDQLKTNMEFIHTNIKNKIIQSVGVVSFGGWSETLLKMMFGNMEHGGIFNSHINPLTPKIGSFVIASTNKLEGYELLGKLDNSKIVRINELEISLDQAQTINASKFATIYPRYAHSDYINETNIIEEKTIAENAFFGKKAKTLYDKPKVLIVTFPGTNSEYDTEKAFQAAGALTEIFVFNNTTSKDIKNSIDEMVKKLSKAQIFMIPGGFSAGDEPDGSGKFIASILRNEKIKKALENFLANEGLILGICNGFQALIKSGLLPYGNQSLLNEASPTLFRNDINRHISHMITTKIVNNNSPWLSSFEIGTLHKLAISHGEGKFVVNEKEYEHLLNNNQIVTRYCDDFGNVTMDQQTNLNGSYYAIEGIISPCGQIFGKMAHSERYEDGLYKNIEGNKLQDIFSNGVNFFKK